ncbi:MAG: tetratricopeptide repeat protein [Deltaproteobacteria bacterium]|nr:tetratricopeptide repeat protein [Deltaproteobacteria bacterium]
MQFLNSLFLLTFLTNSCLISPVWALSEPSSPTQTAKATAVATSDYQEYKSSKYASPKWNETVKSGMEAFHAEDYEVAYNLLYKAFNAGCESPLVLFMLALINEYKETWYSSLEFYKMAEKGFQRSHRNHRFAKTFTENYGRALYYSGKKQEALPLLQKAAKRSKSYWLLKLMGMISYERGDSNNALSYFERAVRVPSSDVTQEELVVVYSLLGKLFLHQGQKDGALRYYQKVLELEPNHPEARQYINAINKQYQNQQLQNMMEEMLDE